MRKTTIETNFNWIKSLNKIKSELNEKNYDSLTKVVRSEKINDLWQGFLRKNNVVIQINGFYKWNEKIPISIKLIEKFREYQTLKNKKNNNKQQPNLFNMPQTPLPKPPKVRKTRVPKIEFQINDKPKSELGVIRRFLKWLW